EEPEADDDEDPEEDPADYPADQDDDDEEEEEPSEDDADDEDEDEDEEEEEHPALADSVAPVHHMTARISIRDEPSISLPPREKIERLIALTTPPPSPLTPLSSSLPHIPSPPLPTSPPASVLPALPPASPTHLLDRPEITLPPRKRLGIDLGPRCEVGESSAAAAARLIRGRRADYGFVDTVDAEISQQRAKERVEALVDDRQYHYETARLLDQEAMFSREAWAHSMGLGTFGDVLGQIRALQARDHAHTGAPEGAGSSA
ncbi:hypothetical protein Tco_0309510, partial [Tanacetum coccineum]